MFLEQTRLVEYVHPHRSGNTERNTPDWLWSWLKQIGIIVTSH